MPKKAKPLSAFHLRRIKKRGLYAVGGVDGLYLSVSSPTARSWVLRVKLHGKRVHPGLGSFPEVSLEKARARAAEMREMVREGKDPRDVQREARQTAKAEALKLMQFKDAAEDCWKAKSSEFKNAKHSAQWIGTLREYAYPHIGTLFVQHIERAHVLTVLKPIWNTKTETATRVRGRIEAVIDYVHAILAIENRPNPAKWSKEWKSLLPSPQKLKRRKKKHHPALPWPRMAEFMPLLQQEKGTAARCTEFAILTTARSEEVRAATWDEIDMDRKVWKVPADRMKGQLMHRVPLSPATIRLLESLPRFHGTSLLFPGPRSKLALSDNTLGTVVDRVTAQMPGNPKATPHGFRSAFKDWARSQPGHEDEVSELCLAHVNSDETRAAYARDELMAKRTIMLDDWARFCFMPIVDNVVPLRKPEHRVAVS
jgi:integrase